jgi:serine protease Do
VIEGQCLNFRLAVGTLRRTADVEVWRRGKVLGAALPLELPPRTPSPDVSELAGRHALAGATVANLSPGFNQDAGLDLFAEGVVILRISRHSPADRIGLLRGDIIASVADQPIAGVDQLEASLDRLPPAWRLEIERGDRRLGVTIGIN